MAERAPRLLVVQHEDNCPPGWIGTWLTEAGVQLDVRHGYLGHEIPGSLADHDGLLVLGGAMDAGDDEHHPWLAPTRALAARVVEGGAPYLGVCLGMQMAVLSLGGSVVRNPAGYTRGVVPVTLSTEGRRDPVLGLLPPDAVAVHYNQDMVVPPAGVRVQARTADGAPQLVRLAERAWGTQCHPEVGAGIFDSWTVAKPAAKLEETWTSAEEAARVAGAVAAAWPALERSWRPVVLAFGAILQVAADSGVR